MRRLPVYFLIDVSESMVGEPIRLVEDGMGTIIKELRTDPYALETVYVSILAFAGKTKQITPLVDLISFYPPRLPIGGGTSLGKGIEFLMSEIDKNVIKTTMEMKGDWKPIVFLFTDGVPTDEYENTIEKWQREYKKKCFLVAISFGDGTDLDILRRLTENVLVFKNENETSYKKFFKWITASIKTSSMSVSENNIDDMQLAKIDEDFLAKPGSTGQAAGKLDDKFAVFLGRCQKTKNYYLMKYKKVVSSPVIGGVQYNQQFFQLEGSFQIDPVYFDLRDERPQNSTINTGELSGFPSCPCCGNQYGFCTCACGNLMCTGNEEVSKCPWCNQEARFGFGEGTANVGRTRG
jgi:uncharacterized protein YegL